MLGCTSQSMIRSRLLAATSCSRMGRSMTSLMRSSFDSLYMLEHDLFGKPVPTFPDHALCRELHARKGFQRVFFTHARDDTLRQMRRHRVVAVELPVRIIGRKQEHLVGA